MRSPQLKPHPLESHLFSTRRDTQLRSQARSKRRGYRLAVYLLSFWGSLAITLSGWSISELTVISCTSQHTPLGQLCHGNIPESLPQPALTRLGAVSYRAIAQIMQHRYPHGSSLTPSQKRYLRPFFGDLVDRVRVIYDVELIDHWVGANLRLNLGSSNAQVYGNRIYVNGAYNPEDPEQLALLAHELVHVRQSEELGGLHAFGQEYFREYKRANLVYKDNVFEREAFAIEDKFRQWLRQNFRHGTLRHRQTHRQPHRHPLSDSLRESP